MRSFFFDRSFGKLDDCFTVNHTESGSIIRMHFNERPLFEICKPWMAIGSGVEELRLSAACCKNEWELIHWELFTEIMEEWQAFVAFLIARTDYGRYKFDFA